MLEDYDILLAANRNEALRLLSDCRPHLFVCKIHEVDQIVAFTEAVLKEQHQIPFLYIGPFYPATWQPDHALVPPYMPQEFLVTVKQLLMRYR